MKKEFGFFTFPGNPDFDKDGIPDNSDPDDDNDGTPDTNDPQPYNPSVPTASGGSPPQPSPPPPEPAPGSPEHKETRWQEYQENGGTWDYERWSNVYDANMTRAREANAAVDAYQQEIGWGRREVTVDAGGESRRLDIADVETRASGGVQNGLCLRIRGQPL